MHNRMSHRMWLIFLGLGILLSLAITACGARRYDNNSVLIPRVGAEPLPTVTHAPSVWGLYTGQNKELYDYDETKNRPVPVLKPGEEIYMAAPEDPQAAEKPVQLLPPRITLMQFPPTSTVRPTITATVTATTMPATATAVLPTLAPTATATPQPTRLKSDVNGDGRVDLRDLNAMRLAFENELAEGKPGYETTYDFNGDKEVNIFDWVIFSKIIPDEYGQESPVAAPVPTPSR